jgi:hypothetical protein
MTKNPTALEPSFADAIKAIAVATDLPAEIRRHWCSSLTGIARAFDQPSELIPARYSAVRARMAALHHVPMNWTAKTVSNHRSNVKAALIWFRKEKDVLPHGARLSPSWDRLRAQLTDPSTRYRLLPLMRFCSGFGIEPKAIDEAVIERYMDHRARTTARPSTAASRRILARLWNAGIGKIDRWPEIRLKEPPVKSAAGPAWEDFSEGLRADVERELARLTNIHRNKDGQRSRPCKRSMASSLVRYHLHPEAKFWGGDYDQRGFLRRRHVLAETIQPIGKEADELEEREYVRNDDAAIEYNLSPYDRTKLITAIKRAKADFGLRALSAAAKVSHHRVNDAISGKRVADRLLISLSTAATAMRGRALAKATSEAELLRYLAQRVADEGRNEIARVLGVDPSNLNKVLKGERSPSSNLRSKMSNLMRGKS